MNFNLNENFIRQVDPNGEISSEDSTEFLQIVSDEMDQQIGEEMSEALSDEQFNEFLKIANGDKKLVKQILGEAGDYTNDPEWKIYSEYSDSAETAKAEYATAIWTKKNIPNYEQIVDQRIKMLIDEIRKSPTKFFDGYRRSKQDKRQGGLDD